MNSFDIFYLCCLGFFFFRGALKGILPSLIGPVCLAFWSILGAINYDLTNNIIAALKITLIGTAVSTLLLHVIIFLGKQAVSRKYRGYVFWVSRLCGGTINSVWNGTLLAFLSIFIFLLPNNFLGLGQLQKDFSLSTAYEIFYQRLITPFPTIKRVLLTISVFRNRTLIQKYKNKPEYKSFFSNPKIRYITENQNVLNKIYSNNAISLLEDPKIVNILQDEALMKAITDMGREIYQESLKNPADALYFPIQN